MLSISNLYIFKIIFPDVPAVSQTDCPNTHTDIGVFDGDGCENGRGKLLNCRSLDLSLDLMITGKTNSYKGKYLMILALCLLIFIGRMFSKSEQVGEVLLRQMIRCQMMDVSYLSRPMTRVGSLGRCHRHWTSFRLWCFH